MNLQNQQLTANSPLLVRQLVTHVIKVFKPGALAKGLQVSLDFTDNFPTSVLADLSDFSQLLASMIQSSINHTTDGEISVFCLYHDDVLSFNISDTGAGIELPEIDPTSDLHQMLPDARPYSHELTFLTICQKLGGTGRIQKMEQLGTATTVKIPIAIDPTPRSEWMLGEEIVTAWRKKLGETERLAQLFDQSLIKVQNEIVLLNDMIHRKDPMASIMRMVHTMKGFSGSFGIKTIYQKLIQMDNTIKHYPDDRPKLLTDLIELNYVFGLIPPKYYTENEISADCTMPGEDSPEDPRMKKYQVLVGEDHPMNQEMMTYILRTLSVSFQIVKNGQLVLDMLAKQHFDLLLLDMQMPVMDGFSTIKQIRANPKLADLPVIAVTAFDNADHLKNYRHMGFNDYVIKPFRLDKISRKILAQLKGSVAPITSGTNGNVPSGSH